MKKLIFLFLFIQGIAFGQSVTPNWSVFGAGSHTLSMGFTGQTGGRKSFIDSVSIYARFIRIADSLHYPTYYGLTHGNNTWTGVNTFTNINNIFRGGFITKGSAGDSLNITGATISDVTGTSIAWGSGITITGNLGVNPGGGTQFYVSSSGAGFIGGPIQASNSGFTIIGALKQDGLQFHNNGNNLFVSPATTITATRNQTFQDASGVIALTSDIPSAGTYINNSGVYQTGAVFNVAHGSMSGTAGNGYNELLSQSASPAASVGVLRLYSDSLNRFSWKNSTYRRTIRVSRTSDMTISAPYRLNPILADSSDVASVYTPQSRTLTAGVGIIGGGDLSANRGFAADTSGTLVTKVFAAKYITQANGDARYGKLSGSTYTGLNIVQAAIATQGRFAYDGSNFFDINVGSTGSATLNLTGTNPIFTVNSGFFSNAASTAIALSSSATSTSSNFLALSMGSAATTLATAQLGGATTTNYRVLERGSSSASPAAGSSYGGHIIGTQVVNIPSSGTSPIFSAFAIKPMTVTTGSGTVTAAASLLVEGFAPAVTGLAAGATYAIYSQAGTNRFTGNILNDALTASQLVATDASKNLVSITDLPSGTTATTQAAADNSTKVATTAYVDRTKSGNITLVAGVGTATVTGVSTGSLATLGFVSIGGTVTTTWQYKYAVTANTVTITAITNAGATNTLDTSVLTYRVTL